MLVALDIDGTLVDYDAGSDGFSPRIRAAVTAAAAAGITVVLVSGRSLAALTPMIEGLGITSGWAIGSNGAITLRLDAALPAGFEIAEQIAFTPRPPVEAALAVLPDALVAIEDPGIGYWVNGLFPADELIAELQGDWEAKLDDPTTKVVLRCPELRVNRMKELLASLATTPAFAAVSYVVSDRFAWCDLTARGLDKGRGLSVLAAKLGVPASEVVAVGDDTNDIPMLRWAGRAVAMGNASPAVRAAADETTASVWDDGAARVLEDLLS